MKSPFGLSKDSPFGLSKDSPFGLKKNSPFGLKKNSPFGLSKNSPFGLSLSKPGHGVAKAQLPSSGRTGLADWHGVITCICSLFNSYLRLSIKR